MTDPSVFGPGYWDQTEKQPAAERKSTARPAASRPRIAYGYTDFPEVVKAAVDAYAAAERAAKPARDAYGAAFDAVSDAEHAYYLAVKAFVATEDPNTAAIEAVWNSREAAEKMARWHKVPKRDLERILGQLED